MSIEEIISGFNEYLNQLLGGNEMLIAVVAGAILSIMYAIVFKLPAIVERYLYRYAVTHIRIDSSNDSLSDEYIEKLFFLGNEVLIRIPRKDSLAILNNISLLDIDIKVRKY